MTKVVGVLFLTAFCFQSTAEARQQACSVTLNSRIDVKYLL